MRNLLKVDGHAGISKDPHTGAILSSDRAAFKAFKRRKEQERMMESKIANLENRLDSMESMLHDIWRKLC